MLAIWIVFFLNWSYYFLPQITNGSISFTSLLCLYGNVWLVCVESKKSSKELNKLFIILVPKNARIELINNNLGAKYLLCILVLSNN